MTTPPREIQSRGVVSAFTEQWQQLHEDIDADPTLTADDYMALMQQIATDAGLAVQARAADPDAGEE